MEELYLDRKARFEIVCQLKHFGVNKSFVSRTIKQQHDETLCKNKDGKK